MLHYTYLACVFLYIEVTFPLTDHPSSVLLLSWLINTFIGFRINVRLFAAFKTAQLQSMSWDARNHSTPSRHLYLQSFLQGVKKIVRRNNLFLHVRPSLSLSLSVRME
jgi:hypothetical protein